MANSLESRASIPKDLPQKVLLLLRDKWQSQDIGFALRKAGFEVKIAQESHMALGLMRELEPHFIIVEPTIEEFSEVKLYSSIRTEMGLPETRIITLGENQNTRHEMRDSDFSGDHNLRHPLNIKELLNTLESLQTPDGKNAPRKVLTAGGIELVPEEWLAYVNGDRINLTEKEYRLLQELMEVKGRVLTRETLLERVWGHQKIFNLQTRTLDVHMSRLRTKLGTSASNIVTVRNVGYRINLTAEWLNH